MGKMILASRSKRRIELLKLICNDFEVMPSNFDEKSVNIKNPKKLTMELARQKALAIESDKDDCVIGCDTVVVYKNRVFGIPQSKDEAKKMLSMLSGKKHSVISGVFIKKGDLYKSFYEKTSVYFYPLSDKEIDDFTDTDEPYDKAGGYGIQEKGGLFVKKIKGDYQNVVGLPIARLRKELLSLMI